MDHHCFIDGGSHSESLRMSDIKQRVSSGVDRTERATESLRRIYGSTDITLMQIREVTQAEQRKASGSIARNVKPIASMTHESETSLCEITAAFIELDGMALNLRLTASSFRT